MTEPSRSPMNDKEERRIIAEFKHDAFAMAQEIYNLREINSRLEAKNNLLTATSSGVDAMMLDLGADAMHYRRALEAIANDRYPVGKLPTAPMLRKMAQVALENVK